MHRPQFAAWSAVAFLVATHAQAQTGAPARGGHDAPPPAAAPAPHHARSWFEMGLGLGLGTAGYWLLQKANAPDWDDPRARGRFDGSAWALDNNSIGVNFLGHPATGALSYSLARANHQGVPAAIGYSFLTSFFWEFLIEFKEKVSLNDVFVTPGAGLPLGEFFYKLGLYLDGGARGSAGRSVARWALGTGVALDRAWDGRARASGQATDGLGFSPEIWHEFSARYGVVAVGEGARTAHARYDGALRGRLVTLKGYGRGGSFGRAFWSADVADFELQSEASSQGWGLRVSADTLLFGWHQQSLVAGDHGPRGWSVLLGSSIGYDYLRSSANRYAAVERAVALPGPDVGYHAPNRREQYGAWQLPGLGLDVQAARDAAALELSLRVQPSFAGLEAPAFYLWAAEHLEERTKHILHRQGYFYGVGGVAKLGIRARAGAFRAEGDVLFGAYGSLDGLDRRPEQVTQDVSASGNLWLWRAALGVAPARALAVGVELSGRRFASEVGDQRLVARSLARGISATWTF